MARKQEGLNTRQRDIRATRRRADMWDRLKILVLLGVIIGAIIASSDDIGFLSFWEVAVEFFATTAGIALGTLFLLESTRQVHYWLSERSPRYNAFWQESFFGGIERWTHSHIKPWTRFRVARFIRRLIYIFVLALLLDYFVAEVNGPLEALVEAPRLFADAFPFLLQLSFGFLFVAIQFLGIFWLLSRGGTDVILPEEVTTRFDDVWGQDHVLDMIKENIAFLEKPDEIEEKGGYIPGGILLWGPPGTGKTLMAQAVAGETGRPYVFVEPGAFVNMFFGIGLLKVKLLYRKLRKLSLRHGGVIVFFDEADSLGNRGSVNPGPLGGQAGAHSTGGSPWSDAGEHLRWLSPQAQSAVLQASAARSSLDPSSVDPAPGRTVDGIIMGGMGGGGMGTLQALLSELSGLKKPRGFLNRFGRRLLGMQPKPPPKYRILVMMATNMPQALDEALLRPGRIDRMYKVGYPSKEGRVRTYEGYLAKVRHELTPDDVEKLATITPYATGATIKDLVNEALINAIRDGREVIGWTDVIHAKHLKELGPPEDVEYIERERHAIAVHEACHAVAAYRTRKHLTIDLATIEKGGTYLGMVASVKPEDQFTRWRSEYEADIVVSLASLAGERLFFGGDNSSGVSGDLESATTVATLMEGYWGMGRTVASHGVTHRVGIGGGGRPGGDDDDQRELLKGNLGERIETNLGDLLDRAEALLRENRAEVLRMAHALEIHKTIDGEDVVAVIEGTEGPLIDGRAYCDDEFVEAMENFHSAVVDAHRAHETVAVPLPATNGQHPVDAAPAAAVTPPA
jgi:ATP-dependent Zn protease